MANPEKNKQLYGRFVGSLEAAVRGDSKQHVGDFSAHMFHSFLNGYLPKDYPSGNAGEIVESMNNYAWFRRNRIMKDVVGCPREFAAEDEAIGALREAYFLASRLIYPFFPGKNDFSNSIFNDIYELGFSYLDLVCSAVGDEFVPEDDVFRAKSDAVALAKEVAKIRVSYLSCDGLDKLGDSIKGLGNVISFINPNFVRPFQLVATKRKEISRNGQLTDKLRKEIVSDKSCDSELFRPKVIFPIAQGGNELGVALSLAFEEAGHEKHVLYPLMFSIKTRKHRHPWTNNDSCFLEIKREGSDVLIVEDWVTTGNTLRGILREVEDLYPRDIRVATIKRDPERSKIPLLEKYKFYVGQWTRYMGKKADNFGGSNI